MDLENHAVRQTYIQLLAEILKKKAVILNNLINLTQKQEAAISSEPFSEDEFLELISLKEEQLKALSDLDDGFEKLYEGVKEELAVNKASYTAEITELKEQITVITDLSVSLQTMETRNKSRLEVFFSSRRKSIRSGKISAKTATNYYKTMAQQHEIQSFFYDKKK